MPDTEQNGQEAQNKQSAGAAGGTQGGADQQQNSGKIEDLPPWAQTLVKELRDEAAERRVALKKQETEAATRETKRLEEEGNFRALADQHRLKAESLLPYQQKAEALEKRISDSNDRRIAQIPEQLRTLVPKGSAESVAEYLDTNWALLTRKPAADLDAGAGSGGSGLAALTDDEKAMARRMKVTDEQFAAQKKR